MPFLPSLLEYSERDLRTKLDLIQNNLPHFIAFQNSSPISAINSIPILHLDFVLPEFALSREVVAGNNVGVVFENLLNTFENQDLSLNVHFMGLDGDMKEVFEFLSSFEIPTKWKSVIFVSAKYQEQFQTLQTPKIQIGQWLDLGEYDQNTKFQAGQNYLLMTVFAGKSGQKLTVENQNQVITISQKYPNSHLTIDGGWSVNFLNIDPNLNIVSYSSFWKNFVIS